MKTLIEFLGKFFQNNGHLRGALYFSIAALTPMAAAFVEWASQDGPKNWYEVVALAFGSLISGLTAVRAYLDTHLSNEKNSNE
jgi:uncharacterized membrane protein (DUF441 family)